MSAAVERALTELGDLAERDVPIGPLTTYRVGGAADVFVRLRSRADLAPLAKAVAASGLPVLVVGRGSNLLVADSGFHGIAVSASAITDSIDIDESSA
jgi:UDP-N-acetylmuramate dehydrogenase